jgi:hypothetical protein
MSSSTSSSEDNYDISDDDDFFIVPVAQWFQAARMQITAVEDMTRCENVDHRTLS